ncbi:MAG: DUF4403 family protein [Desulfuromonadaceae bacterium]|nr:DUF4403 family protein [Desulfuromonadaceae bacterium]MDD5105117.1 DUF4403 family protein [Desulfuromonadaceae bacterium]
MYSIRNSILFAMLIIYPFLISCTNARAGDEPLTAAKPKDLAFRTALKKEPSNLNVTVETTAADLGNTLNRLIPSALYKGSTKTSGVTADIVRNGPIGVAAADNFVYLTVPISISLSYGLFETPTIAAKLRFKVHATVSPDWKVTAEVYYTGLSDLFAEEVGIGPISIKPRSIIEGATKPVQRIFSNLINTKLNEKMELKTQVTKAWNASQKPILLDKRYNAWLMITPQEILLYPFYARNNMVKQSVGLKSYAEVVVGPEPAPRSPPVPLPNLRQLAGADTSFRVTLNNDLYYKDILIIASPLLLDKEFGDDGKRVTLKSLDLSGNGDRLLITVGTTGDLEGTFYLTCKPLFNPLTNIFSVEEVDFDMQTQSMLLQTADWFLHSTIKNIIQEKLTMDMTQRLMQAREMAGKAMAQVRLADNLFLNGTIKAMKVNDVMVQKEKISIQIYAEGETTIVFR